MHKKSYITTTLSGPAVVTESLYEQLPSLSTTSVASEVPYISLDEFLADETTSPNNQINEDKQTGEFPYFILPLYFSSLLHEFVYPWDYTLIVLILLNSFGIWSPFFAFFIFLNVC